MSGGASTYQQFLADKATSTPAVGQPVAPEAVNPLLKPHQRDVVRWAVEGGRRGIFLAFGLGKTMIQLETLRLSLAALPEGARGLIIAPLGVRQEFRQDAETLETGDSKDITDAQREELRRWLDAGHGPSLPVRFIRRTAEVDGPGIYLTNYESVRDGRLDPALFQAVSLDEAACLRGFGGTKTFREFMRLFVGVPRKWVATATPSPNEFIELLAYSAFLEVMDVGEAKTRFFRRNSTKADSLTLHPHKEAEFWLWVSSWAMFLQRPSDLGYSDDGYELPALDVRWHEVPTDHSGAGEDRDGQGRLLRTAAAGVVEAAREKRDSLEARLAKLMELRAEDPGAHRVLWHDLEDERRALEAAIPGLATVYGSQPEERQEAAVVAFSRGEVQEIAGKPVMLGAGVNFQRHCSWAIYAGIGFKFADFIQSVHRLQRFLQRSTVRIDLIYTEAEREIRATLERKWAQHLELVAQMTAIIREHGLSHRPDPLQRTMDVDRQEVEGEGYRLVCGDAVDELRAMESDSVDLVVTSVPFSTQYEYTPSRRDLGHTDDDRHFFQHLAYTTRELYRVVKPGRVIAIHCKDRIVPGGISGLGFQTISRFSDGCAAHYEAHGFAFLARVTIVTDVVRENNQTYRLGWTEQCKDGSRMGHGMPEYVLLLRKPPTDTSNGYADVPVVKSKAAYSLGRWQVDAHGFWRSSGDRPLLPEELDDLPHEAIFKRYRQHSLSRVYDFEEHVALGEGMAASGRLPVTFMLLQPQSWHPQVWTDITRMRTLNSAQAAKGREMHLCPLQLDIADRLIAQHSQAGEVVLDPFGGLFTVAARAVAAGRRAVSFELNPGYFADGVPYVEAAVQRQAMPTLFDLTGDGGKAEACSP